MEDKYTTYTSIQLAGEDPFIRWVRHGEHDPQWRQWAEQDPEVQSKVEEARRIVNALAKGPVETFSFGEQQALWRRIQEGIQEHHQPVRRTIAPMWTWALAAAASLALLVWFNTRISSQNIYAAAGEKKEITLPEESAVTLNAGSYLTYRDKRFEKHRSLHLDGEAFFRVKPGSTFAVKTTAGTVTVLGTSFNVMVRDNRFEVSCFTGKVSVETISGETIVLEPGQKSVIAKAGEKPEKTAFDPAISSPGWMSGKFSFDNQPLAVVIDELERQYNIRVNLEPGLESMMYTGLFESGDLSQALYLITWPLHLQSKTEGNTVTISR